MEEIARVYANALFESGKGSGKLDALQEQLDQFTDALDQSRDMQVFFFSPYFSSAE
jgi:F-type H+-transporting ATPase subunit delta